MNIHALSSKRSFEVGQINDCQEDLEEDRNTLPVS